MKSLLLTMFMASGLPMTCAATFGLCGASVAALPGFISQQQRQRAAVAATRRGSIRRMASSSVNAQDPTVKVVDAMPPALPPLQNHYYLLRHGQSTANVEGIISSARSLAGSTKHGLTLLGIEQGRDSAAPLVDLVEEILNSDSDGTCTKQVYFYSSPFARARETAEQCIRGMGKGDIANKIQSLGLVMNEDVVIDDGLMERYFGRLDGMELLTYAWVWPVDMFEPTHTAFDVESVAAVATRIRDAMLGIDSAHSGDGGGNHIVLTSHADVLQITQCYAAGLDNVGKFSQYRFGNGEVRAMGRDVGSLPEAVPLQPPKRGE